MLSMLRSSVLLLLAVAACAPATRVRRALAPETFVMPERPVGHYAEVTVNAGWADEPTVPYFPQEAFLRDGIRWIEPVPVSDRAVIRVTPTHPGVWVDLFTRHTGLVQRDFQELEDRSGSLPGVLPTTIRFFPDGPLEGPLTVDLRDLNSPYSDDPLDDGDLLMIEVGRFGEDPDRYLFRMYDYGWRTRVGAGVLFRVPLQFLEGQEGALLSPALTASLALGYRARTRGPLLTFINERVLGIVSVGIGSTALAAPGDGFNQQLAGAFNAALIGGGLEFYELFSVQVLGNASAPFRNDLESDWTLAIGVDAVQAARFTDRLAARLLRDHPLAEDRE
jgi:hypothetical protein